MKDSGGLLLLRGLEAGVPSRGAGEGRTLNGKDSSKELFQVRHLEGFAGEKGLEYCPMLNGEVGHGGLSAGLEGLAGSCGGGFGGDRECGTTRRASR